MKEDSLIDKIKEGIADLFYIWKNEIRSIFKDQGVLIFFIVVPLAYPLLYTFIYNEEVARNVPVVAIDDSRSSMSRDYLRRVNGTPDVDIVSYCADMEEAKEFLRRKEAYGVIYIPKDFSDNIVAGIQTQVSIYSDMSGLLYYKSLLLSNTQVSLDMNKDIQITRLGNLTDEEDNVSTAPIEYEDIALFNPQSGFASFLIPAVLILIIQQTLLLGVGLAAGTARERNEYHELVPSDKHYHGTLRIVLGKGLSYFMFYILTSAYMLILVPKMFNLLQMGHFITLVLFILPYIIACVFFAITASITIRNRETTMIIFVFTSVPLLFLSGISWPESAVPDFWRYFSYIFPSTFGINGFVRINSMGATLSEVEFEYQALWVLAGFYFLTACLVYRWQIIKARRHIIEEYKASKKETVQE